LQTRGATGRQPWHRLCRGGGARALSAGIVTLTMNPAIDVSTGVDYVIPAEKLRRGPPTYEPGGGGINVARAVARLGGEALALFVAGGPAGLLLGSLLDAEGVHYQAMPIAAWTRENLNVLETVTTRQFRFLMPGPTLLECEWQAVLDTITMLVPRPKYLVASGSLPPGVPADFSPLSCTHTFPRASPACRPARRASTRATWSRVSTMTLTAKATPVPRPWSTETRCWCVRWTRMCGRLAPVGRQWVSQAHRRFSSAVSAMRW
jgi:hypothetical protein